MPQQIITEFLRGFSIIFPLLEELFKVEQLYKEFVKTMNIHVLGPIAIVIGTIVSLITFFSFINKIYKNINSMLN